MESVLGIQDVVDFVNNWRTINSISTHQVLTRSQAQAVQRQASPGGYYKNCSAARAAGATPVYCGQPDYGSHLDRDNDGVGCE